LKNLQDIIINRFEFFGRVSLLILAGFIFLFLDCNRQGKKPSQTLVSFFNLINEGAYKKAAELCYEDVDPALLDFTYVVSLRFIDKVVVKEAQKGEDRASFYVYLFLKDGKELVFYDRSKEGDLLPGTMRLRKVTYKNKKPAWKVECDEFWETWHWIDVSRKIRLNIVALTEAIVKYRDSLGILPQSIDDISNYAVDTIINPVSGETDVIVRPGKTDPGNITFYYDSIKNEVHIKGYDVMSERLDYFVISSTSEKEEANVLEFFDVPPITISTVTPEYPESEREREIEGTVSLKLLIGRDGIVHDVKIEKQLSPVFDSVAVAAVEHSVFSPAKREGKPVAIWYYFPVRFNLED
jgi:TonB family protein